MTHVTIANDTRDVLKLSMEYEFVQHFRSAVFASHLLIQTATGGGDCFLAMYRQDGDFGGLETCLNEETDAEFLLAEFIDGREMLGKAITLAVNHLLELLPLIFRRCFQSRTPPL